MGPPSSFRRRGHLPRVVPVKDLSGLMALDDRAAEPGCPAAVVADHQLPPGGLRAGAQDVQAGERDHSAGRDRVAGLPLSASARPGSIDLGRSPIAQGLMGTLLVVEPELARQA